MDGRIGLWINKRLVKALELPFPHEVRGSEGDPEAWLLTVQGPGKAVARYVDGDSQAIDLREGDFVMASSDAIYVSRSVEGTAGRGNVPRAQRLSVADAEAVEQPARPARRTKAAGGRRSSGATRSKRAS